jgi:hypothetical protein
VTFVRVMNLLRALIVKQGLGGEREFGIETAHADNEFL